MRAAASPPRLRPYQDETLKQVRRALRSHRSVILQSPTGSGKSVMIAHMIARSRERGLSSWLVCHRRELLDQLSATLWESGVPHGVIAAGRAMTKDPVQVASIQTLVRRLDKLRPPNLLALDECHHAGAMTWRTVVEFCGRSWVIGLTATPVRTDGRGLDDLFTALVRGPSVSDLIEAGHLSEYKVYAPPSPLDLSGIRTRGGDYVRRELAEAVDQSRIVGNAVEHYRRFVASGQHGSGPPTCLVYCVSRAHARHVEAAYREAGIDARYCAGDTPADDRRSIVRGLRNGSPPVVVSVDLFGEGLDCPGLASVQLLRPTQSLGLFLQQVGRALRPEPGKRRAIILDHVGNVVRHGLPCEDREWSLDGHRGSEASEESGPSLRSCEKCFAVYPPELGRCPDCGWEPEAREADLPEEVEGELEEVDPAVIRRQRKMEEAQAQGIRALVLLARERGYKPGWAAHRHAARTKMPVHAAKAKEMEIRRELRMRHSPERQEQLR